MTSSASLWTRSITSPVQLQRSITARVSVTSNGRQIAPLSSQRSRSSIVTDGACQLAPRSATSARGSGRGARRLPRVGLRPSLDLAGALDHRAVVGDQRRHPLVACEPLDLLAAGGL